MKIAGELADPRRTGGILMAHREKANSYMSRWGDSRRASIARNRTRAPESGVTTLIVSTRSGTILNGNFDEQALSNRA